jgi:hypothetical protein
VWEILAANRRVGPVRGDEHVSAGAGPVGEDGCDVAVVVFVVGEGLVEVHHVLHPGEQHLAKRHARDGSFAVDGIIVAAKRDRRGELHLLG